MLDYIVLHGIMTWILNIVFFSPEDLSIIGYNNSMLTRICQPELTSIDNHLETLCEHMITILLGILNGEEMPTESMIIGELVLPQHY